MTAYKDGCYLLYYEGDDYAVPVTLKNNVNPDGTPFVLVVGVDGVKLLSGLKPGYNLYYVLALTPFVKERLRMLLHPEGLGILEQMEAMKFFQKVLDES